MLRRAILQTIFWPWVYFATFESSNLIKPYWAIICTSHLRRNYDANLRVLRFIRKRTNTLIQSYNWRQLVDLTKDYIDAHYIFSMEKNRNRDSAADIEGKSIGKNSHRLWPQGAKKRTKDGYYLNFDPRVNLRHDLLTLIICVRFE